MPDVSDETTRLDSPTPLPDGLRAVYAQMPVDLGVWLWAGGQETIVTRAREALERQCALDFVKIVGPFETVLVDPRQLERGAAARTVPPPPVGEPIPEELVDRGRVWVRIQVPAVADQEVRDTYGPPPAVRDFCSEGPEHERP
jgi:hypothetical protein